MSSSSSAMSLSEARLPLKRSGSSSSRPSTSRFQEGSMNDRASAAPPPQFMGPEQLASYEDQFYAERAAREARRPRPFSAQAQLQANPLPAHGDLPQPQPTPQKALTQPPKHTVAHKKSSGFFGRVRDALFHRGGNHGQAALKQDEVRRKHSSLQEPLQRPDLDPPRPDYLQHAGRTQSEVNIAQIFPSPLGGGLSAQPSREEVLASYNELVSSGFFQSHAIQSTRHAAPSSASAPSRPGTRQTPMRISSMRRPGSVEAMSVVAPSPSPSPAKGKNASSSREYSAATVAAPAAPAAPRTSLSSLFRPSIPDLHTKDSRYTLRGLKRTRDEVVSPEPQVTSSAPSSTPTSYFTQPLRRVAKKLREMPSSSSQLNERAKNPTAAPPSSTTPESNQNLSNVSAEGFVRATPSASKGGLLQTSEHPVRLRSPSPAIAMPDAPTTADMDQLMSDRPVREPVISATARARRPRKTYSYTVTDSSARRGRAEQREREQLQREQQQQQQQQQQRHEKKVGLRRRGSSATRTEDRRSKNGRPVTRGRQSQEPTAQSQNALGQWQRASIENTCTIIHRDTTATPASDLSSPLQAHAQSQWDWEWDQRQAAEVRIASSPSAAKKIRITPTKSKGSTTTRSPTKSPAPAPVSSPLQSLGDANRRGSSVPKAPERWHHSGKAYHLKDRGSRPDLNKRTDSGIDCGKENNASTSTISSGSSSSNWEVHGVDADGDIDILADSPKHMEKRERQRQRRGREQSPQQVEMQWRIGNAL
ncbi:hypothetical protein F4808DRAFT_153647 [Astrocystis sublimbata]|nr:hypothetical protein F4808DRAFT_153647 [Astrocystis sublimbata]